MNKNTFWITVLGLLAGFIVGFWVANNLFYVRNTGAPAANPTAAAPGANPATPALIHDDEHIALAVAAAAAAAADKNKRSQD